MNDAKLQILLEARDLTAKTFTAFQARVSAVTRSLSTITGPLGIVAGGAGLTLFINKMNEATGKASDFEETFSKAEAIFGKDVAARIADWGENAEQAMGMTTRAAVEAVGTMGNMFKQLGANIDVSADLSQQMVRLSADISSLDNVSGGASQVMEAMQSAFRGEYDALQRYIPTISAAAVAEQALADTHKKRASELTVLEKAMATHKIILRDAGDATGDFARTSKGLANQERILGANIDELQEKIGRHLIPVKKDIISRINDWIKVNDQLINQKLGDFVDTVTEKINNLSKAMNRAVGLWEKFKSFSNTIMPPLEEERWKRIQEVINQINNNGAYVGKIGPDTPGYAEYIAAFESRTPPAAVPAPQIDAQTALAYDTAGQSLKEFKALYDDFVRNLEDKTNRTADIFDDLHAFFDDLDTRADNIRIDNALEAVYSDYDAMADQLKRRNQALADDLQNAFAGWAAGFSATLNDMVWSADVAFSDILESFGKMLTQMLIQKSVIEPLVSGANTFFSSIFHGGGVAGQGGAPVRPVSAAAFIGAPRLHNGLLPGEYAAILRRDESVLTPAQLKAVAGSKSQTIININDYSGDVDVRRQQTRAGETIDITLGRAMARQAVQFGTPMNKAMRQMGAHKQLILR